MRFFWIASKYVSLMNNLQSSWGAWDIATQKQGGRLFELLQPAGTGRLSNCGPIPKAWNLENPVWKLKICINVNQSGPGGKGLCLLKDQWFKAGLVSEMAQTFILVGWLPIKSQLDMKLRLETAFVIYTKQNLTAQCFCLWILENHQSKSPFKGVRSNQPLPNWLSLPKLKDYSKYLNSA